MPDLFFNFAGLVFDYAFGLQVRIVRDLACFFFDFTFHLMKGALNLISEQKAELLQAGAKAAVEALEVRANCTPA